MITPEQIRAARALLRIEQGDLARQARVSVATIRRLESLQGTKLVAAKTVDDVRSALEAAGAEFISNGVHCRPISADHDALERDIMALARSCATLPVVEPDFSEADLYDDSGLPA
jgi:predicted transcriptional regulator